MPAPVSKSESTKSTKSERIQDDLKVTVKTAAAPLAKKISKSKFSITKNLEKKEIKEIPAVEAVEAKNIPKDHFSETDLKTLWQDYLDGLRYKDNIAYMAINNFSVTKEDEDTICIAYPSDLAKSQFHAVENEFINLFQTKVNHFGIKINYKKDQGLRKEILSKRKIFDKFAEINPVLNDLNNLMDFDLT